jgi:DNA polymerase-3 subunit delta'
MNLRAITKKRNEIAYRVIENAFHNSKISHNYLISSSTIVNTDYFMYFISQVILCTEAFACGECNNCIRVGKNTYGDLHILDGSINSIKKENILKINNLLNQTSLEKKGIKVLLIKNIENTSIQGVNSLLKIIEEPPENTYIFISTNKINTILPTIKSRAQLIRLSNISRDILIYELMEKEIPEDDSYILSIVLSSTLKSVDFFKKNYNDYKKIVVHFFET